jgi:toxin ParE1/3/4
MQPTDYDVRLLRAAEDDVTEIILYVAADRPAAAAAAKLADRINHKLSLLASNPHLGGVPKEDSLALIGYRYLVLDNYLIFYLLEGQTIYIHRVAHGARDYEHLL